MIVVAGLLIAFLLVLLVSNRRTRMCRWRQDRLHDKDGQRAWRCAACGAWDFTRGEKPPKECCKTTPGRGDMP
ncbi:hypothetical protein DD563_08655 [Pelagicola sp. LXJ1103]|nr:hypothetical protein DD563_08655 [Pelagicola sp. LXJ1103]